MTLARESQRLLLATTVRFSSVDCDHIRDSLMELI
jgi:hypothetical protein